METQEIYERKLFAKAPPMRGKNHACVLSTHSFQRGSALISFSVLLQSGLHQNGQSVGKVFAIFSENVVLYFTKETNGEVKVCSLPSHISSNALACFKLSFSDTNASL